MTDKEKITIIYEGWNGLVYTASCEGSPMNRTEVLEWFDTQALTAIGFAPVHEGKE